MWEVGEDLRAHRLERGMTQEQVALRAGISVQTYSCLERGCSPSGGVANPTMATLIRILDALEIEAPPIREFLPRSSVPEPRTQQLLRRQRSVGVNELSLSSPSCSCNGNIIGASRLS